MSNVIKCEFQGHAVSFTDDGWFNATAAAKKFGRDVHDWFRLPGTKSYLAAFERTYGKIPHVKASRARSDRGGGTWLHPKLAVRFAQWLDDDFSVWCDAQIDNLIRTGQRQAIGIYREILALQREDATSFAKASLGSRLMIERKRQLPGLRARQQALETEFAPSLFAMAG